jgi:hypothetical protein
MINYYFPPIHVVGAIRSFHVYENSLRHFDDTHVITTSSRKYFKQDPTLEIDVANMYEVPAADLRNLLRIVSKNTSPQIAAKQKKNLLYAIVSRLLDSFPFNILIGDGGILYLLKAYALGKRLVKEHAITHLFSSFRPYSDHVVAWLLKRRYPQLFWIADFRDLHVDPVNRNVIWPNMQKKINRFFFQKADLITTVSVGLEHHLKYYGPPTHVLYNGISEHLTISLRKKTQANFTIAYTGSLFKDKRKPDRLLEGIQQLLKADKNDIRINYAGRDSASWNAYIKRYQLEDYFVDHAFISLHEARQLQENAQVNILLTYSSQTLSGNLTGKLYEYFAARNPIIAIINGPRDLEIEQLFEKMKAGLVVYDNDNDATAKIHHFLLKLYTQWEEKGRVDYAISNEAVKQFRWPHLFNNMMKRVILRSQ